MRNKFKKIIIFISFFLGSFIPFGLIAMDLTQAQATALAIQADGNILAAGTATVNGTSEFIVARYTSTGTLDATYGTNGLVTTSIGTRATALGIVVQSNGQSVVVGYTYLNNATQIALVRYNTNGTLDTSFGTSGIVTTLIGEGSSGNAIALQSNGQIVIAGVASVGGTLQFIVARYNSSDGTLDTTFNSGGTIPGIMMTAIGFRAKATAIAIQPSDEKIILAGVASTGNGDQVAVARYNTDGSLDTSFGTQGFVTSTSGTIVRMQSVALQSNGSIVVVGSSDNAVCLVRYSSAGVLDSTFGNSGIVVSSIGTQSQANAIVVDSNDNLVVAGYSDSSLLVGRYTSAGILDTSFNTVGYSLLLYGKQNLGNAVQINSNQEIIAAGYADNDFLVVEYTSSGNIDSSWSITGVISAGNNNTNSTISEIWQEEPAGTNGGTFTQGIWQQRTLNTITSTDAQVSLANNQITLAAGNYSVQISAPAYKVGNHQIRLQNITTGSSALWGTSAFSSTNGGSQTGSSIVGQLSVSSSTIFEVQHMCSSTENNDGLGIAAGLGNAEIYTTVRIVSI